MRLTLIFGIVLLTLAAVPARAQDCNAVCAAHSAGCKQRCAQNDPENTDCPAGCEIAAKTCPALCEVGKRNKDNPERAKREAQQVINRTLNKHEKH